MGSITLISGGTRSGKSDFALELAENISADNKRILIATCPRIDDEIASRIDRHQLERKGRKWITIEEETALLKTLKTVEEPATILIDCLTLWINNLQFHALRREKKIDEGLIEKKINKLIRYCKKRKLHLVCVTSEVGMGLVPESAEMRLYRDLVGRCNRVFAEKSDKVVFVCCGLPLILKK